MTSSYPFNRIFCRMAIIVSVSPIISIFTEFTNQLIDSSNVKFLFYIQGFYMVIIYVIHKKKTLNLSLYLQEHGEGGEGGDSGTNSHLGGRSSAQLGGKRCGILEVGSGGIVVQSSNHGGVNSHAVVDRFEGLLDSWEIADSILSSNHVLGNDIGGSSVTLGNKRDNSEGKDGSFGFGLLTVGFVVSLPGISESSLDERDGHQLLNVLLFGADRSALTIEELLLTDSEVLEDLHVDLGVSGDVVGHVSAGLEVLAPLVSQGVEKLSGSRSVGSLEGSGVESNGLVPRMDGVIITVFDGAGFLTVIKSIFHFADDVHPDDDVSSSLLDDLFLSSESVKAEIVVEVVEVGLLSFEGGDDNLVSVVELSEVVVESLVRGVWAVVAVVHLLLGSSGESLDGSLVDVVSFDRVAVTDAGGAINGQCTSGGEASLSVGGRVGTNLASNVVLLAVGSLVLDKKRGGASNVVFVGLSVDGFSSGINSSDGCSLQDVHWESSSQTDASGRLGEGSFFVNCSCGSEGVVVGKRQLVFHGSLIQINGILSSKCEK